MPSVCRQATAESHDISRARAGWAWLASLSLTVLWAAPQRPTPPPTELTEMSLDELANIEVTSVSRRGRKLAEVAAAVTVITSEDIRRSGATSIPEALRMVPGLQVARIDANKWAISARGFNDRFANKMLVLIDGRSVYTPLFSGVRWAERDLLLEDIERIEVIRGPGATMWGANAVNGVINIITRPAGDTQGGIASYGIGNEERGFGTLRYGSRLRPSAHYRVYARYFNRNQFRDAAGRGTNDEWDVLRGGFRLDWAASGRDTLTAQGDLYDGREDQTVTILSLTPPFRRLAEDNVKLNGGHMLGRWTRATGDDSDISLQFYYDRTERSTLPFGERRQTLDVEFQHRLVPLERHDLLWGVGSRISRDRTSGSLIVAFEPARETDRLFSAFVQDEIAVIPGRLGLSVGTKIEQGERGGWVAQPGIQLAWTPNPRRTAWASVARAVRTPSRADHGIRVGLAVFPGTGGLPNVLTLSGSPEFRAETLLAYQLGYRAQPSRRFSFDVATFYNIYNDLGTTEPGAPFFQSSPARRLVIPLISQNLMKGETYGVEASAQWAPTSRWRLSADYAWLSMQLHRDPSSQDGEAELAEGDNPQHQFHVRSCLDLPGRLQWDTAAYYVDRLPHLGIPSYARLDTRLGWRPTSNLEVSLGLQNLLDNRHPEFLSTSSALHSEIGRSAYGKVTWRF